MLNNLDKKNAVKQDVDGKVFDGIVIDNNDPEKTQRVKIRSAEQHTNISDADIPWARLSGNLTSGLSATVGTVNIPVLGSRVTYQLMGDDLYSPLVLGQPANQANAIEELTGRNYPHVKASIDRSGNLWIVDTKEDVIQLIHVSGTLLRIDGKGHVEISVADNAVGPDAKEYSEKGITITVIGNTVVNSTGNTAFHTKGNMDIVAGGNMNVHAGGTLNLAGVNTKINDNGPSSPATPLVPKPRTRPAESVEENNTEY